MKNLKSLSSIIPAALVLFGGIGFAACNSSDSGGSPPAEGGAAGSAGAAGAAGAAGQQSGNNCPDGGYADPKNPGTCLTGAAAVQACKDAVTAQDPTIKVSDPSCGAGCACEKCITPFADCAGDPGCTAILKCTQQTKCQSVTACYTACTAVIQDAGGAFGISSAYATAIGNCQTKATCPYACQ